MLNIQMSDQTLHRCLLAISIIFIVCGSAMMSYGVYEKKRFDDIHTMHSNDGTVSIAIGSMDIAIGIFGLVCLLLKRRFLFIANTALLSIAIVGNVIFVILYAAMVSRDVKQVIETKRADIVNYFGLDTDDYSYHVTWLVHDRQIMFKCCGWSGIEGENLYLKTPWYKKGYRTDSGKRFTIPPSCCNVGSDACYAAKSLKEARESGTMHKQQIIPRLWQPGLSGAADQ